MLSKGLAETFKAQPLEPRKYFAKYLLNYAEQKRKEKDVSLNVSLINLFESEKGKERASVCKEGGARKTATKSREEKV